MTDKFGTNLGRILKRLPKKNVAVQGPKQPKPQLWKLGEAASDAARYWYANNKYAKVVR